MGSVYTEGEIESGEVTTVNQPEAEIEINPSQLQLPQSTLEPVPNFLGKQANEIIYRLGLSTADCRLMCQQRYGADGWVNLSPEQQQDFLKFLQEMELEPAEVGDQT